MKNFKSILQSHSQIQYHCASPKFRPIVSNMKFQRKISYESKKYSDNISQIACVLNDVCRDSKFCAGGKTMLPWPSITIENVGMIKSYPVSKESIKQVMTRAPFGMGRETVIDTAVRDCLQLEASKVTVHQSWNDAVRCLVNKVSHSLGINGEDVEFKLYKIFLYEIGGHFKSHRDTEKEIGMFASLIIQLPSDFTGGALVVRHAGIEKVFPLGGDDGTCSNWFHYAAHFADCEHEVRAVESGSRIVAVYSLFWSSPASPQLPAARHSAASSLQRHLTSLQVCLGWALQHQYTSSSLEAWGILALKGEDRVVAETLVAASNSMSSGIGGGLALHLVRVDADVSLSEGCDGIAMHGLSKAKLDRARGVYNLLGGRVSALSRGAMGALSLKEGLVNPLHEGNNCSIEGSYVAAPWREFQCQADEEEVAFEIAAGKNTECYEQGSLVQAQEEKLCLDADLLRAIDAARELAELGDANNARRLLSEARSRVPDWCEQRSRDRSGASGGGEISFAAALVGVAAALSDTLIFRDVALKIPLQAANVPLGIDEGGLLLHGFDRLPKAVGDRVMLAARFAAAAAQTSWSVVEGLVQKPLESFEELVKKSRPPYVLLYRSDEGRVLGVTGSVDILHHILIPRHLSDHGQGTDNPPPQLLEERMYELLFATFLARRNGHDYILRPVDFERAVVIALDAGQAGLVRRLLSWLSQKPLAGFAKLLHEATARAVVGAVRQLSWPEVGKEVVCVLEASLRVRRGKEEELAFRRAVVEGLRGLVPEKEWQELLTLVKRI